MTASTAEFLDGFLAHYGKKGMKWGVRNDGTPHTKRSAKKEAKADAKWEKSIYTMQGAMKVHNAMAEHVNSRLGTLNDKYAGKDLTKDKAANDAYESEYMKLMNDGYKVAVTSVHGSSPSGKKQAVLSDDGDRIEIRDTKVEHADFEGAEPDLMILLKRDANGFIVEMNQAELALAQSDLVEEFFLAHFGVKGMRWGVRKPAGSPPGPASEVSFKNRPDGKKLKTTGGKEVPAHEDAKKAAVTKQIAKKSTTDALSNQELQALVTRMQLEANYKRLNEQNVSAGRKFITKLLTNKQQRDGALNAASQVQDAINAKRIGDDIKNVKL